MITPCLPAANGYSYTYEVQGQTIILTPCVNTATYDHYKWYVRAMEAEEWFSTRWIPVEDLDTKRMTLEYDETYHVILLVKDDGRQSQTGEYIQIGSDHSLTSINENTTEKQNSIDALRAEWTNILTLELNVFLFCLFLCGIILFLILKKKKIV